MYLQKNGDTADVSNFERGHLTDWKHVWPSFMCDILVGAQAHNETPFHKIYDPQLLWKMIPS